MEHRSNRFENVMAKSANGNLKKRGGGGRNRASLQSYIVHLKMLWQRVPMEISKRGVEVAETEHHSDCILFI